MVVVELGDESEGEVGSSSTKERRRLSYPRGERQPNYDSWLSMQNLSVQQESTLQM